MTLPFSQRGKEYLETARTLLRAAKTMTDQAVAGQLKALAEDFETHRNIDPVTKDIVLFDNNITDVNADAEFDPLVLRHVDILFGHAALNFVGTSHGVDHAGELSNSAVPGILDDASVMLSYFGIKKSSSKRLQSRQRAFFVYPYQAARARDIRRQNCCQSSLYELAAQDGPPCSGTLSVYIAQLSADVRLCAGRKWVINGPDRPEMRLPLFPRKRTQVGNRARSEKCLPQADLARCYSMTSVAAANNSGGTVRPSFLAVFRLMARSNLIGC